MATYRMSAHPFTIDQRFGSVATVMMLGGRLPNAVVEAKNAADLEAAIAAFGPQHAPCNVWVGLREGRKFNGYDKWQKANGAAKWLFFPDGPHCPECGHLDSADKHTVGCNTGDARKKAKASGVALLVALCDCPKCGVRAITLLTPEQRLAQPDDTTHVCHPLLGGCNHGFTDDRTREPVDSHGTLEMIEAPGEPWEMSRALMGLAPKQEPPTPFAHDLKRAMDSWDAATPDQRDAALTFAAQAAGR